MIGKIVAANARRGMYAIELETGEHTVFELLDSCTPELGDVISGALESLGGETFSNLTQRHAFEVFVQDIHASRAGAAAQLR